MFFLYHASRTHCHHGDAAEMNAGILACMSEAQQGAQTCAQTLQPPRHTVNLHGNK